MTTSTTSPATAAARRMVIDLSMLRASDTLVAGGKGANLGELVALGMPVPPAFVVSALSWVRARDHNQLKPRLERIFDGLDHRDDEALSLACDEAVALVLQSTIPAAVRSAVTHAREDLVGDDDDAPLIVRSSATLEDSATASFAGMNETYSNVEGEQATLDALRRCWASLFARRTVFYRAERGMPLAAAEIAVVVQRYVPAAYSGIMFTADPAGRDPSRMLLEATIGSGSAIVSGRVTPDRFVVDVATDTIVERQVGAKELQVVDDPGGGTHEEVLSGDAARDSLPEADVLHIAQLGARIARHYGSAQDVEWLVDHGGAVWIVQSRPITAPPGSPDSAQATELAPQELLLRGVAASAGRVSGRVRVMTSPDDVRLEAGEILVATMTSPDWAPLMRRAGAIVTDAGGMTCHAAIVAREMGVPCVVGTGNATSTLQDGQVVTVDGSSGTVFAGRMPEARPERLPEQPPAAAIARIDAATATEVMVNLSDVTQVERVAALPCDGIGLLRAETMLVDALGGAHPLALIEQGRADEAVGRLAESIDAFATAFAPRPITYRTIDFRSNEFRRLDGGEAHELVEANPMIGFRGAGRYADQPELLELEVRALATVWLRGRHNLRVMLPFVRTPRDVEGCLPTFDRAGLLEDPRFELWVMAEVPSVLYHLGAYRDLGIHGISIGTNDLTQLLLGADRDSERLARYDAMDPAVVQYVQDLIHDATSLGLATSICGQAPAVHPGYVDGLVRAGIGSISVTSDALDATRAAVARAERRILLEAARV